jgi:8-oxo-dGTP pyrophosphatase MutT (NUDIX family)
VTAGRGGPQHIPRPPLVDEGRPAPWVGLDPAPLTPDGVRQSFAALGPARRSEREHHTRGGSAVLAPLYEAGGELHVILTRRSPSLRVHSGEVSFPGGRREPDEPLPDTARREAHEEIGLHPDRIEIVGELDHLSTITSGSFIVPYVGLIGGGRPEVTPNPAEVEAVLHVPLAELLLPEVYREERWHIFGGVRPIFFFELHGDTVWGATAAMLRQMLGLLTGTLTRGDLDHE